MCKRHHTKAFNPFLNGKKKWAVTVNDGPSAPFLGERTLILFLPLKAIQTPDCRIRKSLDNRALLQFRSSFSSVAKVLQSFH